MTRFIAQNPGLELENERVWLVAARDGWIVKFLTAQEQRAALKSTVDMPRVAASSRGFH